MRTQFIGLTLAALAFTTPALAYDLSANVDKATAFVNDNGVEGGQKKIEEAGKELVDLKGGHGMHVFAMTNDGKILFDFSGQTKPGDETADLALSNGDKILKLIKDKIAAGNGKGVLELGPEFPNPSTNEVGPSTMACELSKANDIVCAMGWK